MDIVFIRHGQGNHTLNLLDSFEDPSLTPKGVEQAKLLRNHLPLSKEDLIIVSPTKRTIQTALIWSNVTLCKKIISPMVSPRMFPQNPEWHTLLCDKIMGIERIRNEFPTFTLDRHSPAELWPNGINIMADQDFKVLGERLLGWCKQRSKKKVHILSHDGTITSYRELISKRQLSREDFLKDAGWVTEQYEG